MWPMIVLFLNIRKPCGHYGMLAFPGEEIHGLISKQWKEMGWQWVGREKIHQQILGVEVSYHWKICCTLLRTFRNHFRIFLRSRKVVGRSALLQKQLFTAVLGDFLLRFWNHPPP